MLQYVSLILTSKESKYSFLGLHCPTKTKCWASFPELKQGTMFHREAPLHIHWGRNELLKETVNHIMNANVQYLS